MSTLNFPAILASDNVRAFLRVIREGETSQDDDLAYRTIVGGGRFDSFADHPRVRVWIARLNVHSTAAGAYQFLERTWDDVAKRYGLDSFSPYNQDCGAVALIHDRGAIDDVIDGRLEVAIARCAPIWASLPGDVYGQGGITMQRARAVYRAYGGAEAEGEPVVLPMPAAEPASGPSDAVTEEKPTMAPALIMGLISSLAEIFSPLVRAKLTKALDKTTGDPTISGQIADRVIGLAQQAAAQVIPGAAPPPTVSGAPASPAAVDPVVAVGTVKSNPALAAQVEAQVASYLEQIGPALDRIERMEQAAWRATEDSATAAAARHAALPPDAWDMTRTLVFGMLGWIAFLTIFVCVIAAWQTYVNKAPSTEVWAAITGLLGTAGGIVVTIVAFRFGYSRQSGAKDALLSELATRR